MCGYHYHKANDSLCYSKKCGEPIEGPCAVSHSGDRFHPEHLLCEWSRSRCREQLKEYYEVDGQMLCERHANIATRSDDEDTDKFSSSGSRRNAPKRSNTRAMKRVTQFIDLR